MTQRIPNCELVSEMRPSPLVSVVIPTFNYGHLVGEAVDSVLAQTYPNIEVIVVDDGSTDDTRERLAKYGERIRYHYQPNAGLSAARNTGIGLANGEFIALLDSDDAFHRLKIELQMRCFERQAKMMMIATGNIPDEFPRWQEIARSTSIPFREISLRELVLKPRFAPSSVLCRRECFEVVGKFDAAQNPSEDRDMWIRSATFGPIGLIDLPLTWYRLHPNSMSRNALRMEQSEFNVLQKAFSQLPLKSECVLRRRAMGLAAMASARRYQESGEYGIAVRRVLQSCVWWPFCYTAADQVSPLGRLRLLVSIFKQSVMGRKGNSRRRNSFRPLPSEEMCSDQF